MRRDKLRRKAAWAAVGALPLLTLVLMAGLRRDLSEPPLRLRGEMASSPAYLGQAPSPVLPGGASMRAPVPGTLARGQEVFRYGPGDDEMVRAGRELFDPLPHDAGVADHGREVYETFCSVCHGPSGAGDGTVVPPFPNPPDLRADQTSERPDGALYHIITLGRKKMPAHRAQLDPRQRWQVIRYLRSLQGVPAGSGDNGAAAAEGDGS